MADETREKLRVGEAKIAVLHRAGGSPGVAWLGGYRSDMTGTKAEALSAWAAESGHASLRHDYSGHGQSGGAFADGTISRWVAESLAVLRAFSDGPQILVGSSMGGWIALRMIEELRKSGEGSRVAGLVLLAPAPDFTVELMEPLLTDAQRAEIEQKGYLEEHSEYSDEPNIYTKALFDDGRANRVMVGLIDTGCPVHILQGMADPDVPYTHAEKLMRHLPLSDVTLSLIRDGDHRLSRPQDIAMLISAVENMVALAQQRA
ncbi:MAG: alpha/beta hydrolase [Mesorhizobium sp.]